MFISTTAGLMVIGHASPILQTTLNMTPQEAAYIVGILSAANVAGRLLSGDYLTK